MWDFKKYGNNIAITDDSYTNVTYDELDRMSREIADKAGGRCLVVVFCENTIGSLIGYTAFLNNGIVPLMLSAHLETELRDALLKTYQPKYVWLPVKMADWLASSDTVWLEKSGHSNSADCVLCVYDYCLIRTSYRRQYPLYDNLALLLTTSGSTGSPKFVRQSYSNIRANTNSIVAYLKLNETERAITTLPMNYTYGLSIINTHLMVGATLLITDKAIMQKDFWEFFQAAGATSFGGVPYTYETLKKLRFMHMELPALKTMTQAGGKLTPELHEEFARYARDNGKQFIVMYGQCEATARMGYLPADQAVRRRGSMGIAIPGGRFTLTDADGNLITEPYVTGELVYEGDNVTLGYAECGEDLIKGDERGGVLWTGDMAQFDEDGYYYIVGRKKRFLKIYGNRVNLDEIDRLIKAEFSGIDCASAGVDDHMYIFLMRQDERAAYAIRKFIAHKTGIHPTAFQTVLVDEVPKSDSGKILYKELEKYFK